MKAIKVLIAASILLIAACTPKEEGLEEKRKKLADINTEIEKLKADAKLLEGEIAKLDTSKAGTLKTKFVKVEVLQPQEFNNFIEVQGAVDSDENVLVNPGMPGTITTINVVEGQQVTKGQILATTDANVILKQISTLETAYDLAKTAFEKQERLWNQKIGSEMQYLNAKTQKESLEKQLKTAQAQLDLSYIKSPINGIVDEIKVKVGEMTAPGFSGIRVVNLNNIKVEARISDNYVSNVKKGQTVIVRFPDINYEVKAPISFVGNTIGANRSFGVEVKINNNGAIKPNMIASLLIEDAKLTDALVVPSNTIEHTESGNYIMVASNEGGKNVARRRQVTTGIEYNGQSVIKEGIKAGDKIITFGFQDIVDGQPINF